MIHRFLAVLVIQSILLPLQAANASSDPLVAVSSNFLGAAKLLAREFQRDTGLKVRLSAASTGKLYAQIIHGAPYAVFLAANRREPERLEREGHGVNGTRFTYALGKLVLWSPSSKLLSSDPGKLLVENEFKTISIANPRTAPYGEAAHQVLVTLGVDTARYRMLQAENVNQAYQFAATGGVEVGFVAYSQLVAAHQLSGGNSWLVPENLYSPIEQQALLLKNARDNEVARAFLRYLRSEKARVLIKQAGYGLAQP